MTNDNTYQLSTATRYDVPLVADIHFQPGVAMMVADAFEKVCGTSALSACSSNLQWGETLIMDGSNQLDDMSKRKLGGVACGRDGCHQLANVDGQRRDG